MLLKRPLFVKDNQAVLVGFRASETEIKEKPRPSLIKLQMAYRGTASQFAFCRPMIIDQRYCCFL